MLKHFLCGKKPFYVGFCQRLLAAFRAIALRRFAVSFTARAFPPALPPFRPRFAASGFCCSPAGVGLAPVPVAACMVRKAISFTSGRSLVLDILASKSLMPACHFLNCPLTTPNVKENRDSSPIAQRRLSDVVLGFRDDIRPSPYVKHRK